MKSRWVCRWRVWTSEDGLSNGSVDANTTFCWTFPTVRLLTVASNDASFSSLLCVFGGFGGSSGTFREPPDPQPMGEGDRLLWEQPVAVFLVCYFHPGQWTLSSPSLAELGVRVVGVSGQKIQSCSGALWWGRLRRPACTGAVQGELPLEEGGSEAEQVTFSSLGPCAAHGWRYSPERSSGANGPREESGGRAGLG